MDTDKCRPSMIINQWLLFKTIKAMTQMRLPNGLVERRGLYFEFWGKEVAGKGIGKAGVSMVLGAKGQFFKQEPGQLRVPKDPKFL